MIFSSASLGKGKPLSANKHKRVIIIWRLTCALGVEFLKPAVEVFDQLFRMFHQFGRDQMSFREYQIANCFIALSNNFSLQIEVFAIPAIEGSLSSLKLHYRRSQQLGQAVFLPQAS